MLVQKNAQPEFEVEFFTNYCREDRILVILVQNISHLGAFGQEKKRITLSAKNSC
jgi:hypothetical protein